MALAVIAGDRGRVSESELLPLSRRQRSGLIRVGHGLYRGEPAQDDLRLDLLAWQSILRGDACFGHLTSARFRGWWLPPLPADLPVFVAQHRRHPASERPELRVTRHPVEPVWTEIDGVRLLGEADTLLACARDLSLLDLVVLVDCALHRKEVTSAELVAVAGPRRRGAPRLRAALGLADSRSESAWETLLRVLHVVCGVEVEPQHELHDEMGQFVARGDLWLTGTRTFHEYDGADHLVRRRQRKDLRRVRSIDHAHWTRRGYTREDVLTQGVTILREADLAVGREHDPSRIRGWNALLRDSLFTPAGTAAFRARIGLPDLGEAGRTAWRRPDARVQR